MDVIWNEMDTIWNGMDVVRNVTFWNVIEPLGFLFYIVNPSKHSYETVEEVPEYVDQVIPYFLTLFVLELVILRYQKKPAPRVNDLVSSVTQGVLEELSKIFFRSWLVVTYIYVYNNYRIITLPWNSWWTWFIALIAIDFCYYWGHRASHEINFLWASHQVHHSSEEYNLSTALRQSVFQGYILSFFYVPMALAVPPSIYLVHTEFNLLYQFWIHTEVIKSLGPLEYIFNTASHHRVHHGRNRYCIDKNYAGTLIIWDRMFGTFEPEGEKVVYGLTHPINTFEPIYIQLCHYLHICRTFWSTEGFKNKLSVIFKGPGWAPGLPWHGRIEDIPDVKAPMEKYDPQVPLWCKLYVLLHYIILTLGYIALSKVHKDLPTSSVAGVIAFEIFSLSILGMLSDARSYAPWLELARCTTFITLDYFLFPITELVRIPYILQSVAIVFVRSVYVISLCGWLKGCIKTISFKLHNTKKVE